MTEDEADTLQRQFAGAMVVGLRVVTGITPEDMAERMGYLRGVSATGRARKKAVAAAVEKLLAVERDMADTYVATYQRYSRALDSSFRPHLPDFPAPPQTAAADSGTLHQSAAGLHCSQADG